MITYPHLRLDEGVLIGVTAPSSGVPNELHEVLKAALRRMEQRGFQVTSGDTAWTQSKAKSAPALIRAAEIHRMMRDNEIDLIIPPWGGELFLETLEHIDFDNMKKKWVLGYSDISGLLLSITLKTGMATAHGTNLVDLRGEFSDETTAMWQTILSTPTGGSVLQHSSERYQKEWNHAAPSPCVFHLTEPTNWKTVSEQPVSLQGRLLGGCIDIIRHLIGTPYGDVAGFRKKHLNSEPLIWYLENCEMNTADLRRSLVQMRLAGWFDDCSGIMFGRSSVNTPVEGYTVEDVYMDLADDLGIPIVYDIDCGHVPPQITFVNGAHAEVTVENGKGSILQEFRP
ncbi:S66 family peptidase [Neobacillus cucumis]|uniref:LD-carboxypeptidase n=1 Tax=Neobacillus cucumis TaxID=1740721 RepID=A0A2N5HE48_9BACI|nr:S66 peptidase family protein [Neobacillus cucumis]PLS03777.1 LD-carboxypeptidase [Neobacillus cucumis]